MAARIAVLWVLVLGACTTPGTSSPRASSRELVVAAGAGELFRGAATYTVRQPERAVALPGLGEILVAPDGSGCRLVWSKDGLDRLVVLEADRCAERLDGRLCFAQARFARPSVAAATSAPSSVVVDGCADENDLLWSRLEGDQRATVGPTPYRSRCRKVPKKKGCDVTYLALREVTVESNATSRDGFSFVWDGDNWRACFLEQRSGAYALDLFVEDSCGAAAPVHIEGDSAELDD